MNKVKLAVACAALAASMTVEVSTAEAGSGLRRFFRVAHTLRVMRHTQPRIHVYRQGPSYRETTSYREPSKSYDKSAQRREATSPKTIQSGAAAGAVVGIRQADARGRVYDPASMAWFDGGSQCWTGTQPWTFKNNAWFYGNARWYSAKGGWQADMADPPAPVGCQTVPAFASAGPSDREMVRYEAADAPPAPERSETKSLRPSAAAPVADRPANCKKYLAVIGETVSVPCEG
jgi:hypothetical protein